MESFEDMGDAIPRTTSRTEVGSAKASRMNSCGIFGSPAFSILAVQTLRRALGATRRRVGEATRLTGVASLGEVFCGPCVRVWWWLVVDLCREAEWMDGWMGAMTMR